MTLQEIINQAADQKTGGTTLGSDLLKEASAELAADMKKAAVTNCKDLITRFASSLKMKVDRLKGYRKAEKDLAEEVAKTDRAFRYFAETGNPFPMFALDGYDGKTQAKTFARALGIAVPEETSEVWSVPSDWTK